MAITDAIRLLLLRRWGGEPTLALLVIDHDDLVDGPIRLVANSPGDDVTVGGNLYTAVPFDLNCASDDADPPRVEIVLANVDGEIGRALETITTPAEGTVTIVAASDLTENIRQFAHLDIRDVKWNGVVVTGVLSHFRYDSEPFPMVRVTPNLVWSAFQ